MATATRMAWRPRRALAFLVAVLAVAVGLFGAAPASAATTPGAENRVGAPTSAGQVAAGATVGIGAGQRLGNDAPQPQIVVATGVAANTGGDLTTVGRWMSAEEHGAMSSTGMVQEGGGGTTYVAHPADPAAFGSQAATGSRYVEFGVPPSALRPAGKEAWAQIPGPNSLYGRRVCPEFG